MAKSAQKKFETCPMLARSDWGVSQINSRGLSHCLSSIQSSVGFHGPKVAGWLVFQNGCHRGEDMRLPIGETKIGSTWQNDCVITGVGVGSQHALIRLGAGEASIHPVATNRIVKIDNQPISERRVLEDGCLISLGEVHCVFRLADNFSPGYRPSNKAPGVNIPSQAMPMEMVCGWLVFSRGVAMGQDFRLVNGDCRVGSQPGLEIALPDAKLPKHALTLLVSKSECKIKWVSEHGQVLVNGETAVSDMSLRDSDVLEINHLEAYIKWLSE